MNIKIEKLKEKHAKELAEVEREESVRALLPIKADEARVMIFGTRAHVSYEADTLADALAILRAFDRVPFTQCKGTFLSHKPADWYKAGDLDKAKSVLDGCQIMLTIDGGKGFGPTSAFTQWARLENNEVIELHVKSGFRHFWGGGKWHVQSRVRYGQYGDVIEASHTPPNIVSDVPTIRWGAGSRDAYSFSWVWLAQETFDTEMERYAVPVAA